MSVPVDEIGQTTRNFVPSSPQRRLLESRIRISNNITIDFVVCNAFSDVTVDPNIDLRRYSADEFSLQHEYIP